MLVNKYINKGSIATVKNDQFNFPFLWKKIMSIYKFLGALSQEGENIINEKNYFGRGLIALMEGRMIYTCMVCNGIDGLLRAGPLTHLILFSIRIG